jgi:hypothetical protein
MIKNQVKCKKLFGKDIHLRGYITITCSKGIEWFYISPKGFIRPANKELTNAIVGVYKKISKGF